MNWDKIDRALSALGTGLLTIGVLVPSPNHTELLWYVALTGGVIKCFGAATAYLTDPSPITPLIRG